MKAAKAFLQMTKLVRLVWALVIMVVLVKLGDRIFPTDPLAGIAIAFLGTVLGVEAFFRTMRPKKPKKKKRKRKLRLVR